MKALVGIGIHRKPDMLPWLLGGIRDHFPGCPTFVYMEAADHEMHKAWDDNVTVGEFRDMDLRMEHGTAHILEHGVHRLLIERFMHTDADVLIVPQDDNRFERPLLPDLQKLWDQYGTTLGWISGRDGHGLGYEGMVCSPFSDSTGSNKTPLPIGEYREVMMMNTGPVVYFRHVVEKVGLPDPDMPWYWWSDLSLRCHNAGLKNILLSMDAQHRKFGRISWNAELYEGPLVADCLKRFNDRWRPVYGRNPL